MPNIVYIATSIDGYIADRNGGLAWLEMVPNPDGLDFGWAEFMADIDGIVMGRHTFETVCGFDGEWPYTKPVFVLSNSLDSLPEAYDGKAQPIRGPLPDVVNELNSRGYERLYIDGGITVQGFLQQDLIDEMVITVMPVLLGGGTPLFSELEEHMAFEHVSTRVLLDAMVQTRYRRRARAANHSV